MYIHMATMRAMLCLYLFCKNDKYCIRQIIQGGKLLRFSQIFANRECFTIEIFP